MAQIFISYSSQDKHFADMLYSALEANGHEVWMDRAQLRGGDAWVQVIQRSILWAETMIVVWSVNALNSRWVRDELTFAHSRGKQIIPVQIDDTDGSEHIIINALQIIDARQMDTEPMIEQVELALIYGLVPSDEPTQHSRPRRARRRWWFSTAIMGLIVLLALVSVLPLLRPAGPQESVNVTLTTSVVIPSSTPRPGQVIEPISLESLNVWREQNGYPALSEDPTLDELADSHVSDLRSRPLSEPYNEYRDKFGRSVQEMADERGFGGEVEMFVKITDGPMPLADLLDEIIKRGGLDMHTRYDLVGFDWVASVATGNHYYVLIMGRKG